MVSRSLALRGSIALLATAALVSCARGGYDPQADSRPAADQTALTDGAGDVELDHQADSPHDLGRDADLLSDPALAVIQSSDRIDITAASRFVLSFEQQYRWQATGWRDLATSPSINLGAPGPSFEHKVLQNPLLLQHGSTWQTLTTMLSPTMSVKSSTAQQVVLETSWLWAVGPGVAYSGKAVHTIKPDGTWTVTTTVTNTTSSVQTVNVEYADTHLAPVTGWTATKATDDTSYKFVRKGTPAPRPTFVAARPLLAEGKVGSDEAGNQYWAVSSVQLVAGGSKSWTWTNRFWPGE